MQCFNVIFPSAHKRDGSRPLTSVFVPLPYRRKPTNRRDPELVGRICILTQPEFASVIAGNPKSVVSGHRRIDISSYSATIILPEVGRAFKVCQRNDLMRRRANWYDRHVAASYAIPYFPLYRIRHFLVYSGIRDIANRSENVLTLCSTVVPLFKTKCSPAGFLL